MKLNQIYQELITEDFKTQTKKFITQGYDLEIVKTYIDKFKHIRDKKFKELFDPEVRVEVPVDRRQDIDAYKNFHDLEIIVDYVAGKRPVNTGLSNSNNNIEVSGEAVYRDENIEVFYADNPRACIKYKGSFPYSWCVSRSDSSNMFYTYRFKPYEPAFYFVKDIPATKKEFDVLDEPGRSFTGTFQNKYHFFVIQVPKNIDMEDLTSKQYIVSSAQNDGDTQMSWNEILAINPKLDSIHDILEPKPFTPEEKAQHERFKKGVSDREFTKLSYEEKKAYLEIYPTIAKPITNNQLMELPDDLLNLYVSYGVGLDDIGFNFIRNKPAILKRYAQISKRKFDEYINSKGQNRTQLMPVYSEIMVLSEEEIKIFLKSLSGREINQFIRKNGTDKFELLEKHLGDKAVTTDFKTDKDLLIRANNNDEEALEMLFDKLPEKIDLSIRKGFVTIDFSYTIDKLDGLDRSITYFINQTSDSGYWVWGKDNYFEGWDEGLDEKMIEYVKSVLSENETLYNDLKSVGIIKTNSIEDATNEVISYLTEEDISDGIKEKIGEVHSDASREAKQDKADEITREFRGVIEYNEGDLEVIVSLEALIIFIRDNEFFNTDEDEFYSNVSNMMSEVLEIYDLPENEDAMSESIDDSNMVVDSEEITSFIFDKINEHLEEGIYNDEDEENDTEDEDTTKKRQQLVISYLTDTLKNMGQDPYSNMIENDIVRIDIDRRRFKINGQVYVKMSDKQNGKLHEGYIFIKDLPTYFTNYKLFEQVNKIKRIINYDK